MTEAPVMIEGYDPSWPGRFAAERERLETALATWLAGPIEHIGSTAVPGLAAKPVIDIMAAVESLTASRQAIRALESIDYLYYPYRAEVMHWFCKPALAFRTHHLHLVPYRSALWIERLRFRDHLRAHHDVATEYAALKRTLAEKYRLDREAYTDAKGPFIARVLSAHEPE
jgi:GrpB-like predicted nucleotidyltransferase (UPF0157 family)